MLTKRFDKGDYVVYSSSGVCCITDIKPMSFQKSEDTQLYYVLTPQSSRSSTIFVPTENETLKSKMRTTLTKLEVEDILQDVKNRAIDWIDDKSERTDKFKQIVADGSRGSFNSLILMAICIYHKKKELSMDKRKLSLSDEGFLRTAESIITDEFSYALGISPQEVGSYIHAAI